MDGCVTCGERDTVTEAASPLVNAKNGADRDPCLSSDTIVTRSDVAMSTCQNGILVLCGPDDSVGVPQVCTPHGVSDLESPLCEVGGGNLLDFRGVGPRVEGNSYGEAASRMPGAGVWSSSSSGPPPPRGEAPDEVDFRLSVSSWNLAGASKKKVVSIATSVLASDILAVQEYPKMPVGWRVTAHEHVSAVLCQDVLMYRAIGVLYNNTKFSVKGIWVLLKHKESAKEAWIGSVHLPVNAVVEELERFQAEFLNALPATCNPCVLLGDFNTRFTWEVKDEVVSPKKLRSRWSKSRQGAAERGFVQVCPQEGDASKPTFVSRKSGITSAQIDGMFCARCRGSPLAIHSSSRHEIGTDHERITGEILLRGRRVKQAKVSMGGPRQLLSTPPPQPMLDDQILAKLAQQHTGVASLGPKFRMSGEVRRLRGVAKANKTPQAWTSYLSQLRREKQQWKAARIEQAAYDWGAYKQMTRNRVSWTEGYMLSSTAEEPEREIVAHFKGVFHDADRVETVQQLQELAQHMEWHLLRAQLPLMLSSRVSTGSSPRVGYQNAGIPQ